MKIYRLPLLLLALCLLLPATAAFADEAPTDNAAAVLQADAPADAPADVEADSDREALCESDLFAPEELDRSLCPPGWECYSNNDCNFVCPCTGKCVACSTTSTRGTCSCYYC